MRSEERTAHCSLALLTPRYLPLTTHRRRLMIMGAARSRSLTRHLRHDGQQLEAQCTRELTPRHFNAELE